ncbi:hypothetical protein GUJ93_ZPchr0007g4600 [Zizania palustris]|uniref:Uncharacterized protein n=1 Tax=Zizania palustris TaxID=103762 RepID=A0A8J5T3C8_ZIZPA|nr:hypothetical protein GUJ93_ZPchr0007g4600 [Zizania palustris]
MEVVMAARRLQEAAGVETAAGVMGTRGAGRAAGRSLSAAVARAPPREAAMEVGTAAETAESMGEERPAAEATMPAAAMTEMTVAERTPEGSYSQAKLTSPEAKNDTTQKSAAARWTTRTGMPAGVARAAAAAGHTSPSARRTPTRPALEAGRDPRRRPSPSPPSSTICTAAKSGRAGRGSAAPRRRPDLHPLLPISSRPPYRGNGAYHPPTCPGGSRQRRPTRLKIQILPGK